MINWKPTTFGTYYGETLKGFKCDGYIAAVYMPQPRTPFWICLHLPSGKMIGFRLDTETECKKAAEYLMSSKLDWNVPTLADLLIKNGLTIEEMEELESDAVDAAVDPVA